MTFPRTFILVPPVLAVAAITFFASESGMSDRAIAGEKPLPEVPVFLPDADDQGHVSIPDGDNVPRVTTIVPRIQNHLTNFITDSRSPIAAVVVMDIKTGSILAMAQGRKPEAWGGRTHSALHPNFPAASLFKTVITAAAFETADVDAVKPEGLLGGCANVRESGEWMVEKGPEKRNQMSLRKAYGLSCNGYFAKLAVNHLGLGVIRRMARSFGWEFPIPTDFALDRSPIKIPAAENSSTHTIGRFAAGFGQVGISAVHAAWNMAIIGNSGRIMPVRLFQDTHVPPYDTLPSAITPGTAQRLLDVMDATVRGGTASSAFRRSKYKKFRDFVGGKTGTLTGSAPKGLTTWFTGVVPLNNPEVAIAAVVVLDERWHIKAPNLAAEAVWAYYDHKTKDQAASPVSLSPVANSLIPVNSN
jgi:cell division protein FtsI/penicillin-binding protein 2